MDTTAGASSSNLPTDKHTEADHLSDVHKSMVDAFSSKCFVSWASFI
jgi:hypothetical protein